MRSECTFQLIVVVVETGRASALMEAARAAGAEGGTVLHGRGTGIHEQSKFLGIPIEPEKEILIILIEETNTETVLEALVTAGELNKPGKGIAFVLDVAMIAGICHRGKKVSSLRE
ncbi:MAG: P-II family nitrogen regulator [Methanophagales archaeon ANME-1-THS]|nr:MAG: P-II family nitrogen regulator [Methanophagales archaeon ANME-1-THS]